VSTNGGTDPQWARNGRELYYIEQSGVNRLMAVPVLKTATFDFGTPTLLFESNYAHLFGGPNSYDVAADGRFLMIKPAPAPSSAINVIFNWTAALTH
jgi:serine/threonine-protein kinase